MAYKKHKQYRLPGFDYSSKASYFITIVTKSREHFLGEIKEGEMFLSEIGKNIEDNFKIIESTISHIQIE
jgi:putative transposase